MATRKRYIFAIYDDETVNADGSKGDFVRYPDGTIVARQAPIDFVPDSAIPLLEELLQTFPLFLGVLTGLGTCATSLPVTPVTGPPTAGPVPVFVGGQDYELAPDAEVAYLVDRYILVAASLPENSTTQAVLMELYSDGVRRAYPGVVVWSLPTRPTSSITIDAASGLITVPADCITSNSLIGVRAAYGSDQTTETPVQLINVAPNNPAPTLAIEQPDVVIDQAGLQTFVLPAGEFSDPGDSLTYTVTKVDGSALPSGVNFNPANRTFSVAASFPNMQFPIRVVVTDSAGQSSPPDDFLLTVNRAPANPAPTLAHQLAGQTITLAGEQAFSFPEDTFSDPGDTLSYSAVLNTGQPLPNGLLFDPSSRSFTVPAAYPNSQVSLRVRATDSAGQPADMYFLLTVNRPAVGTSATINKLLAELPTGWHSVLPSSGALSENVLVYAAVPGGYTGPVQMRFVQSRYPGGAGWGTMLALAGDHPKRAQGYTHSFFYNDEQLSGRTAPFNQFVCRLPNVSSSDVIGQLNVAAGAPDGAQYQIYPAST